MKNKDLIKQGLLEKLNVAMKSEDEGAIAEAFADFATEVQQNVLNDVAAYRETQDVAILQRRGVRVLTQKEKEFYEGYIEKLKIDPKQAFSGSDNALPESVIEDVLGNIKTNHPLLQLIDFKPTTAKVKLVMNAQGSQKATWGALNSTITKELNASLKNKELTICKLTAYLTISQDMLEAGAEWLDAYVREILSESIALGLEDAIITGTGKNMPIGMDRQVQDDVTVTSGEYPKKEKIVLINFSPTNYGELLSKIATDPNDSEKARPLNQVVLIVNPFDYFTKIMPATTVLRPDGTYATEVFPFPTVVIQSCAVERNTAIIGLPSKYFLSIGPGTNGGKIEYSDEFKFLDDLRTYKIKMFGNGRATDDNAFKLLDISKLVAVDREVVVKEVKGTVNTKAAEK